MSRSWSVELPAVKAPNPTLPIASPLPKTDVQRGFAADPGAIRLGRHERACTGWLLIAIFVVAFGLLISRRPDAILNAQFWAEDGASWYAGAYQDKGRSLLRPQQGYYQTVSRLTALAACELVPFHRAPLLMNVVALSFEALVVVMLLSSRLAGLAGFRARLLLSLIYVALPNSDEIHANITNTQWHLALLATLVLFASAPRHWGWRSFDVIVVALSSVSGPFCLLLAPLAWTLWWVRRRRWNTLLACMLSVGATATAIAMLRTSATERISHSMATLGVSSGAFLQVLGRQVFLGSLIGVHGLSRISLHSSEATVLVLAAAVAGIAALSYALAEAKVELRLLVMFGSCIFVLALFRPMVIFSGLPIWQVLQYPCMGGRYWFLPMVAFLAVLVWMAGHASMRPLRVAAVVALLVMSWGGVRDWHHPRFVDLQFQRYAHQFETAPPGTQLRIPINPPSWSMVLQKH